MNEQDKKLLEVSSDVMHVFMERNLTAPECMTALNLCVAKVLVAMGMQEDMLPKCMEYFFNDLINNYQQFKDVLGLNEEQGGDTMSN